jgi:cytochrome c-type biogenesis protein
VATIGFSVGLDGGVVRDAAAVVLGAVGVVLLTGSLRLHFALATSGFWNGANGLLLRLAPSGITV